jgi:hypothetical protein
MLRDLFSTSGAAVSDADLRRVYLVCRQCCRRGRVRVCAFITRIMSHPASAAAGHELLAQLTAHPVRCLASQLNVQRWRAMLRFRTRTRRTGTPLASSLGSSSGGLCCAEERCCLCLCRGCCACRAKAAFHLAQRRHFLGSYKDEAKNVFEEGRQLYGEQRFSEAAERWGRAALLQHAPSHAQVSDMLIEGRSGVAEDRKRGFELAKAGAALGCAHSKGALGLCYVWGYGVADDEERGLALGRESAAAGSCFGQYVVGACYHFGYGGVAQDYAEAVRLYSLAAAQGNAIACFNLGVFIENGYGAVRDKTEAIRWYRLAVAWGYAEANFFTANRYAGGGGGGGGGGG